MIQLSEHPAIKTLDLYWKIYGGWKSLLSSPYVYVSLIVSVLANGYWRVLTETGERIWPQLTIDIVPSMLGFSMGGMAIMLAFGNEAILKIVTQEGNPRSFFMNVIVSFFHFIIVQTIAIFLAILSKAYSNDVLSFVGFWSLAYAILVGVATAGQLLQTARIYNQASSAPKN